MANKRRKNSPRIVNCRISCDICEKWVTIVNKKYDEKSKKIWICNDCNEKYPIWKN